jgi:hypothetical protein
MSESENVMGGVNIIAPPTKKINFVGEIVEIKFVPARIDLEFNRVVDESKTGRMSDYEGFNIMTDLILSICKSNPNITKDWLLENTSYDMMMEFFLAAKGKTKAEAEGKVQETSGKN